MKYLSPVKHLYRVAYSDPTEHIKRVQNLNIAPIEQGFAMIPNNEDEKKKEQPSKKKKTQRIFQLKPSDSMNQLFENMLKQNREK